MAAITRDGYVIGATPSNAEDVNYDNSTSGLEATDVQGSIDELKEIIDSNPGTTYTFANGTNGFTVTPSDGSAQTVTVTPSFSVGTGDSNGQVKINGTNASVKGLGNDAYTSTNNVVYLNDDIPEGAANLSATATAHKITTYRNGFTIPYQMDNTNDGGMLRVRGTTEDNCILELGTWDDSGIGETIQFNYYPTTSQVTPTYSVVVPKKSGTIALTSDLSAYAPVSHSHNYAGSDSAGGPANIVKGAYTGSGGQKNPNYFGVNKVGFLMMNTSVNGDNNYKDWIIMDCYGGNDVGGGVAFGVNRQKLGAYIMRSDAARTSWSQSAELLGTHNYTSYCATANHGHGLLHNDFTVTVANTTSDSGWSMINPSYNGFLLKSIRYQGSSPNWGVGNYGSGIAFGGADTKGIVSVSYDSPNIRFAGGNGTKPVWWMGITGGSGVTYDLSQLATKTDISTLQSNFQAGVDSVYNAIRAQGTTPASKSLSDVVNAIGTMSNNRYNAGYSAGYNAGAGAAKSVPYSISLDGDSSGSHKVDITFGNTKVVDGVRVYYSDDLVRSGNITY